MSALPPIADMDWSALNVRFVPLADTRARESDCHAFRAINSTAAMQPLDILWIIFCSLSGVFRPTNI